MDADRWARIEQLCQAALERPGEQQTAFLESACGTDQDLRREVESLLAHRQPAEDFMEGRAMEVAARVLAAEHAASAYDGSSLIGRLFSQYRIVEKVASGGMGDVYRAVRADGQYSQQVALKIVRADLGSQLTAARFRNERQILASLDHPSIAKILDGGASPESFPYLVMEFIDGLPVTEYCDQRKLSIDARLKLFRVICSAVHYAHQHLVIHRDIKPTNMLVTADAIPKLLDFGIAKILDPELLSENVTLAAGGPWLMTPEYASPEQLRGETITTSTDVYSLGLVLYELLTGHRAHRFASHMPHEVARAVLETDPEKPSMVIRRKSEGREGRHDEVSLTEDRISELRGDSPEKLRRRLAGDLDNIVLKAIRKEPSQRYSSADQLSEDIRRYLEALPVLARKSTVAYRCRKYVLRHKLGVTAAVLVLLSLLTGIALTAREARIARANQLRAEQRFNDVRKLANSLIFQIHDSVQNLQGATPARKLILDQALEYLDSLATESGGDASLQRELASAYTRVATLQGIASESNLGQGEAGLVSFGKALAIREAIAKANPTNTKDQLELAVAHRLMARMLATAGRPGASEQNEQALTITAWLLKANANNFDILRERAIEFELAGDMQDDPSTAIAAYRSSLSITQEQLKANPQDKRLQQGIALVSTKMGSQLAQMDSRNEALKLNQSALDALESLAKDQTDARYSRNLAQAWAFRSQILLGNGDAAAALAANRHALQIAEGMAKGDPQNMVLQLDMAAYSSGEGISLVRGGKYHEGELSLGRAIRIYEEKLERNHADTEIPWLLGHNLIWMGKAQMTQGKTSAAAASYRKSIATLETLKGSASNDSVQCDLAAAHLQLGAALAKMGDRQKAAAEYGDALAISEPLTAANPTNLAALYTEADAYFGMGQLASAGAAASPVISKQQSQQPTSACNWYRKSSEAWHKIPNPGFVSSSLKPCGSPSEVAKQVARCDAALAKLTRQTQ